jgi:hypothetical protein
MNPLQNPSSNTDINDIRSKANFSGVSFSKYKRAEVRKQLIESIKKGKLEPSCYWSAELICAGHFMEVWETILHYAGKHIHLGNPKIVLYLEMRFELFKSIVSKGEYVRELDLRNHPKIRKLFGEIISTLVLSNKTHSFEPIKINRVEEFDMTQMTDRLKAPSISYIEPFFEKGDPKELIIALNEFAYNISAEKHSTIGACYWVEWLIDFDAICRKRKEPCYCEVRNNPLIEKKFRRDIVWILWDALFHYCGLLENIFIGKIMNAIHSIFCIKYTTASCKKRRYLLYFAVALLTEPVPVNIELMPNKAMIENVTQKINEIYKQIKKNEESPNTEYLFANLNSDNTFEQSLRKMELVNSLDIFGENK